MTTDSGQARPTALALPEIPHWICLSLLAGFILAVLGKVLFTASPEALSDGRADLAFYFVHWRYFGFHELKSGNLALWNPCYYCGVPFFGNFQSALLYPINWLFMISPLAAAINWTIAINVFLGGVFTFYWVRNRGVHSLASLLAAVMFAFCAPHFLQIQAGHLPNLCTLIWAPLLFLSIDRMFDNPGINPCLLGMFALAMSLFAGHPQYVFYMCFAAAIYAALNLAQTRPRGKAACGLAAILLGGICLGAIQLFTGLDEGSESARSLGTSYDFAASYSFPPENFLTLVAPGFFGDGNRVPYWGRWYVTEVSLFVSVMGLALAFFGMLRGAPEKRRFSIVMLTITILLAMGSYTPLFRLLYHGVPGFNLFRGMDKFLWLAALFLSMLAAIGLDQLLRAQEMSWPFILGLVGTGLVLCVAAYFPTNHQWWSNVLGKVHPSEGILPESAYSDAGFIAQTSARAIHSLIQGGVCFFLAAALFVLVKSHPRLALGGIFLMAAAELCYSAHASLMTFKIGGPFEDRIVHFLQTHPGDYRIKAENPNSSMITGALDIGGSDPSGLLRYSRFLEFTEGIEIDSGQQPSPQNIDPQAWRMLRCRYWLNEMTMKFKTIDGALPRVLLLNRFQVMTNYHKIFDTLSSPDFDFSKEVILEEQPQLTPVADAEMGEVSIKASSTDYIEIEASVKSPCLLMITDSYSKNWRCRAKPGSAQTDYRVMPANYCLRVVPLAAGHHYFRMEYSPTGFRIGKIVSIAAWVIFLCAAGYSSAGNLTRQKPSAA